MQWRKVFAARSPFIGHWRETNFTKWQWQTFCHNRRANRMEMECRRRSTTIEKWIAITIYIFYINKMRLNKCILEPGYCSVVRRWHLLRFVDFIYGRCCGWRMHEENPFTCRIYTMNNTPVMDPKERTRDCEKAIFVYTTICQSSVFVTLHITDDGNIDNTKRNKNNSHSACWKRR